jgi:prepilin-type N-terminal cleavage/methylation domain-containing protein
MFSFNTKNIYKTTQSGFSLIELMVTIAIVTLVTGLVMVKYSTFNSAVILKSQAYEMALDIREAQVLGVSVGGSAGAFRKAYGIYIDLDSRNTYKLFQDAPNSGTDKKYDPGEEIGETYTIDPRFAIYQICTTISNIQTCDSTNSANTSISFKRPDFDAQILTNTVSNPDQISIVIASTNDVNIARTVVVYGSGQISVQ